MARVVPDIVEDERLAGAEDRACQAAVDGYGDFLESLAGSDPVAAAKKRRGFFSS